MLNEEFDEHCDDIPKKVQSELDLLRSSVAPVNSSADSSRDESLLHPTVQICNDTLADIRQVVGMTNRELSLFCESRRCTENLSSIVDKEILQSYHAMKNMESLLRGRIQQEHETLAYLQHTLDEHLEINRALDRSRQRAEPKASLRNRDHYHCNVDVEAENTQLHDDLFYIANCIEKKVLTTNTSSATEQSQCKPLHELILRFAKQRIDCPNQPYLDLTELTTEFHAKHIQLLQEALILESSQQDTNKVALIDYTANDSYSDFS